MHQTGIHILSVCIGICLVRQFSEGLSVYKVQGHGSHKWLDECDVIQAEGCGTTSCCVYQVRLNRNKNFTLSVRQICQALRTEGELCLLKPENFMCYCKVGLVCTKEAKDNYGHCNS